LKIYTRTGDQGNTSLLGGTKVSKSALRLDAYGTVDELNSYLGLLADLDDFAGFKEFLRDTQENLFSVGSHLACESDNLISKLPSLESAWIKAVEDAIDKMDQNLPAMKNCILPGGKTSVSFCHIARCVCRRAERRVIGLSEESRVNPIIIQYLNRLSDYLFILARAVGQEQGVPEIPWKPKTK